MILPDENILLMIVFINYAEDLKKRIIELDQRYKRFFLKNFLMNLFTWFWVGVVVSVDGIWQIMLFPSGISFFLLFISLRKWQTYRKEIEFKEWN